MLLRRYHEKQGDEGQVTTAGDLDPAADTPEQPRRQRTRKGSQPRRDREGE